MEVLAVHTTSMSVDPGEDVEWIDEERSGAVIDGAILALTGVEPGDRAAVDLVTSAAGADLESLADEFGVETIVVVPSTTERPGRSAAPESVLDALGRCLSRPSVVVPAHAYPDLLASGTAHPTAIQRRRYDGWLAARIDQADPSWSSPPEQSTEILQAAGLLSADDPVVWTPAGQFLVDVLLDRTRNQALKAGARLSSIRDQTGGPPAVPPAEATAQLQYGVRTLPEGVRPEFTCGVSDEEHLAARFRVLLSVLEETAAVFEQPLHATVTRSPFSEEHELVDLVEAELEDVSRTVSDSLPEPVRLAVTIGTEPSSGRVDDDQPVIPLGTLVVAMLEDRWCLQCGPLGRLDQTLAALVALSRPVLPPAIAPTQLRLVPVSDDQFDICEEIAEALGTVRVDIDDRGLPVDQRLQTARDAGVPYYAVVGRRESESETLPVTDRRRQTERQTGLEALSNLFPTGKRNRQRRYGPLSLGSQ